MTGDRQSYFFDAGLRFECTQCGKCCTGGPGVVRVSNEEITALAEHLGISRQQFAAQFVRPFPPDALDEDGRPYPGSDSPGNPLLSLTETADHSCIFFADGRCTVYPVRPSQCRTFPFWMKNLRNEAAWQRVARSCPGIGRGPLRNREEILRIVSSSPA